MQHSLDRRGAPWPTALGPSRTAHVAPRVPATTLALPHPTWATPTREERAHALLAAWRAETRDPVQRALLREMLAHFRRSCILAGCGDPLRRPPEPAVVDE